MNPRGFPHESTPSLSSLVGEVRSGATVAARKREPRAVCAWGWHWARLRMKPTAVTVTGRDDKQDLCPW